ncbi:Uma2 family endonuclease [Limnoglobus roseus]|uniref:Uma2 family endonuclease n=1 Tax=Limnoglobus roseus TaxID=2598579 RepID=A0A5C1A8X7_9BACT|nr:Uma2 family endonuclease [Limnoglobus roseus]QEL15641.1 Uma2 family endonuclease [Limnoglobus roseus]
MATMSSTSRTIRPARPADPAVPQPFRITVEQYHRMGELGFFTAKPRCELIRGIIVEKLLMNPPHKTALRRLIDLLRPLIPEGYVFDSQGPISLADSEPEPDVSITLGPDDRYSDRHAGPDEVVLLVEVADSSLEYDRGEKLQLYAEAGISVYWVVNLRDRSVTVYTRPRGGRNPGYRNRVDYTPGAAVPVVIGKKTIGTIPVTEILP